MRDLSFIDCETTHLNPAIGEIIEICIIRQNPLTREQDVYYTKIQPLHLERAHPQALQINGYNMTEWREALPPEIVAREIVEFLRGSQVVAHNARFDLDFVEELLYQYNLSPSWDRRYICTMTLSHEHLYFLPSISMRSIRDFFGWSHLGEHTATTDCQDVQRLYWTILRASLLSRIWWRLRRHLLRFWGVSK